MQPALKEIEGKVTISLKSYEDLKKAAEIALKYGALISELEKTYERKNSVFDDETVYMWDINKVASIIFNNCWIKYPELRFLSKIEDMDSKNVLYAFVEEKSELEW